MLRAAVVLTVLAACNSLCYAQDPGTSSSATATHVTAAYTLTGELRGDSRRFESLPTAVLRRLDAEPALAVLDVQSGAGSSTFVVRFVFETVDALQVWLQSDSTRDLLAVLANLTREPPVTSIMVRKRPLADALKH